jgi:hypothetical protein
MGPETENDPFVCPHGLEQTIAIQEAIVERGYRSP